MARSRRQPSEHLPHRPGNFTPATSHETDPAGDAKGMEHQIRAFQQTVKALRAEIEGQRLHLTLADQALVDLLQDKGIDDIVQRAVEQAVASVARVAEVELRYLLVDVANRETIVRTYLPNLPLRIREVNKAIERAVQKHIKPRGG